MKQSVDTPLGLQILSAKLTVGHIVRYSVVASVGMVSLYSTHVTNLNTIILANCY